MKDFLLFLIMFALPAQSFYGNQTQSFVLGGLLGDYFESHEAQIRDFHSRGGHLPDDLEVYLNFLEFMADGLDPQNKDLLRELETIRFLRRHVSAVAIIAAPGVESNAREVNLYIDKWLSVAFELDKYEQEIISRLETR